MISWVENSQTIDFYLRSEDATLPFAEWEKSVQGLELSKFNILTELIENGQGIAKEAVVSILNEEICRLSSIDQQILNLPSPYPFDIRIDHQGLMHQLNFKLNWGFYEHSDGNQLFGNCVGCIVEINDGSKYLLSSEQYELVVALNEFNSLTAENKNLESNLLHFAEIKSLSKKSAAVLDSFLGSQTVIAPSTIDIKIKNSQGDTIEIAPQVDGVNDNNLEKVFDLFPTTQSIYSTKGDDGGTVRVVFTDHQKKELSKIKSNRRVGGEQKQKIIERPQELFNPDIINLDNFSKRVIEIGLYKPKYYPFICPFKSQWIPGILIKDIVNGTKKVFFKTKEEFYNFQRVVETSKNENKESVNWNGEEIPLTEVNSVIMVANQQFKNQSSPVEKINHSDQEVIIIKENVEQLEHTENEITVKPDETTFIHRYILPKYLKNNVRVLEHQKEGIAWLQSLYSDGYQGALLADDMGLGKTLQVLSFITWHHSNKNKGGLPYLIVAPVSLLENWESEYKKFFETKCLPIFCLYGNIANIELSLNNLQKPQIVLTTYETLRSNKQFVLCAINWAVTVLDEAQKIKTPGTLITNISKALKSNFSIAMTGTPVENTLVDLWCIIDYCIPGFLGSAKDFSKEFQKPQNDKDTDLQELGERLRKRIGIHIKRRLKSDVLHDLPQKYVSKHKRMMPPQQIERYKQEIWNVQNDNAVGLEKRNKVLRALFTMRDISDHPFLVERQFDLYSVEELINSSAKMQCTIELLKDIQQKNEKVIVFAERKEAQRLLKKVIDSVFNMSISIVNGDTPAGKQANISSKESRQQTIERFQGKPSFNVIVMSPLATGFGLNITEANHVIHYSRHWNPAKEEQATDRVYRIGQNKDVFVHIPMAVSELFKSFDVILDELLSRKSSLSSVSLFPTERVEVKPEELFDDVFRNKEESQQEKPFTIEDVDKLDPYLFEATVAAIWEKQGYDVLVTPRSNDKGADVVCFSEQENILIQAKQSRNIIGDSSIGEIMKARGYYNQKYQRNFSLAVATNRSFTKSAYELALKNNVKIFQRESLIKYIQSNKLLLSDIMKKENLRQY